MNLRKWLSRGLTSPSEPPALTPEEAAIMAKVAAKVVDWKMTVPAILFLESVKPLNYVGAQALVFFEPIVQTLFNFKDYDTFRGMLEKRENMERLLQKIEELDAAALEKEREARCARRAARGGHSWRRPFGGSSRSARPPS